MAGEPPAAPPWAAVPGLRIASLCSGYGGLDLAVRQVLDGDLVWVAETDKDASAVLRRHWPGVPNYGDITAIDWEALPPEARAVDVLTAGFPCQPFSQAGRRRGADDPRHLWPHIARAVGALRPQLVVLENVRGLLTARGGSPTAEHLAAEASRDAAAHLAGRLGGWLGNEAALAAVKGDAQRAAHCRERAARLEGLRKEAVARCQWHERRLVRAAGVVLGDLADLGFDAEWACVTASSAGAPHRRERVFIIAWPRADAPGDGGRQPGPGRAD